MTVQQSFGVGTAVEYYSESQGSWLAAVVLGCNEACGTYQLDVHPAAAPHKIRLVPPKRYAIGAAVEYYSTSRGGWVPAMVKGIDESTGAYNLDIQSIALPDKVRAAKVQPAAANGSGGYSCSGGASASREGVAVDASRRFSEGTLVEYYSTSQNNWVPTVVRGYNAQTGFYITDIQPMALPSKLRASTVDDISTAASPPAVGSAAHGTPAQGQHGPRCGLCQEAFLSESLLGPSCGHQFCGSCLRRYVFSLDFTRERVTCPCCDCQVPAPQVERFVGSKVYRERREEMAREDAELAKRVAQGETLPCQKCGKKHDEGTTCAKFSEWEAQNRHADRHFEEFASREGIRRCPKCNAPCEREKNGCNFMQCRSDVCRKWTYWCFLCNRQLPLEEHYTHYPGGPYEDRCVFSDQRRLGCASERMDGVNAGTSTDRSSHNFVPAAASTVARPYGGGLSGCGATPWVQSGVRAGGGPPQPARGGPQVVPAGGADAVSGGNSDECVVQ
eukprot:TRINITY_DN22487_c0_g1_i1.p1 TRINITY_DN22487_c0_g1~~TRINITY_DN22487_c0_g1_i1.p1  ORF type:complete len:502 (-),score=59.26 TRINITY_DN22487_c0_g1_i1:83-1588(-)